MNAIGVNGGILVEGGVAECECCEPACDDPLLDVTLTWTDSDTTKDYLGETWTNGETRAICPDTYDCENLNVHPYFSPTSLSVALRKNEFWGNSANKSGTFSTKRVGRYSYSGSPSTYTATTSGNADGNVLYLQNNSYKHFRVLYSIYRTSKVQSVRVQYNGPTPVTTLTRYRLRGQGYPSLNDILREYTTGINNINSHTPTLSTFNDGINNSFEGSITSSGGLTIAWAKNNTGVAWGDCF